MKISTRHFGDVEIEESKIIVFEEGIPGFENLKKFVFMNDLEKDSPFYWLQSIEDVDITFTMMDVFKFLSDYAPEIDDDLLSSLGERDADEDIVLYNIVTVPSNNLEELSVNLRAPVLINLKTFKAKQIITENENYAIRYYIYKELKKDGDNQC